MSNQYLSFDVTKQSTPQQLITGRQGDSQLKFVTMLFWDGDKNVPYDLTGKQVAFEALKPDNTHIVDYEGITILNAPAGLVRYSFNEQVFAVAGTMQQAFFKITHTDSDNNVIADSTLEVAINILENRVEFGINSKDYLSEYDDLIVQVKKKFDDYAATVKDSIDKAQALHDKIVEYTNLINSKGVILSSDFGNISSFKQSLGQTFVDKLNNEFNDRGVNVKWFGAVGDGVTDDTEALIKARDFCDGKSEKQVLFFPPGDYLLNKTLQFNTEVEIVGTEASWLKLTGTGDGLVLGPDNITDSNFQKNKRFTINGLGFKGGDATNYGIRFNKHVTQSTVFNCNFFNFGGTKSDSSCFAIWFDTDNWYGLVQNCKFDVTPDGGQRQFVGMAPYGNSRVVVRDNLVTSLSGLGVAVLLDGFNCQLVGNKIEGYQVSVRLGSEASNAIIAYNYFEKSGSAPSGAIHIGDLDANILKYPTGIFVNHNYCNLHSLDGKSYFIAPSNSQALITNLTMSDNYINGYIDSSHKSYIVFQNDIAGQTGNIAERNRGVSIAGIVSLQPNISHWNGMDSAEQTMAPIDSGTLKKQMLTTDGTAELNILNPDYSALMQMQIATSKDMLLYHNARLLAKSFSTGQVAFGKGSAVCDYDFAGDLKAKTIGVSEQTNGVTNAGQIYEGTDGNLYYMNLKGQKKQLTS